MTLKYIRLELARDPEFPDGSAERGYELVAPLDADGMLDAAEWRASRERCKVRRIWPHQPKAIGYLVHRPGGSWAFDYDPDRSDDDEPGFKLDRHRFAPGEYVSFKEADGVMRAFVVRTVSDLD